MGPRFGSSLKVRIAAMAGLLFLVGIGLITLFVTRILHADMQEMVSKQQLTAAQFVARDIDGKLTLRLESLKRVAQNIPERLFADPSALQLWLEDRRAINTLFPTGLMLIPPDGGTALAETPHLQTRPKSFADRDWFIGAVRTGQPYFSKPLVTRATGEPALVIAIPVFSQERQLLGVLAGITPLATPGFLDLIIGARPGRQGRYQLIAPQHRIFALTSDMRTAITPLPASGQDPVVDQAIGTLRGSKVLRNAENEEELAVIVDIPSAGWLLLAALSRLLQPMARLAGEIHDMAEGTRPMLPLAAHAADEVADVANSFNRLQEKLQAQERSLAEMAHHDILTGLPNRLLITDRLDNELKQMDRVRRGMAVLFLDLDGFKAVNDTHGHQVGDQLLIEIARRLLTCVRSVDTVGRLGGDEFLILLSHPDGPLGAAERVAGECLRALSPAVMIGDLAVTVGASIGIVACDERQAGTVTASQLMRFADVAMYRAKAGGRNRYAVHSFDQPQTASLQDA